MRRKALITGGAGFIGTNLAVYLLKNGWRVNIFDNLSRRGTRDNLLWIQNQAPKNRLTVIVEDIRSYDAVRREVATSDVVYHLAGQVAVTNSYLRPREDFEINLGGAINVLEGARAAGHKPIIIYSSTNKVYGGLDHLQVVEQERRYSYKDVMLAGIAETQATDFHSPYGCSKGGADQYMRDYYRMYGIPTVVFRQSCIYGPRQMGMEDQGWTAHFAIKTCLGELLTIYGNGKQVRDLLHVEDLIGAYQKAVNNIDIAKGKIYNIGGGREHAFSLLEYVDFLDNLTGKKNTLNFEKLRPGDQKIYISDTTKLKKELSWRPRICHTGGLKELYEWVKNSLDLFRQKKILVDVFETPSINQRFVLVKK